MVVETVLPVSKQFLVGRVERKLGKAGNVPDTLLAEYDEFDDYLEMVIQFGVSYIKHLCYIEVILSPSSISHCLHRLSLWGQL